MSPAVAPADPGSHPAFSGRLETDAERKVWLCYPTTPGWKYFVESTSDLSGTWTREPGDGVYGGGQEMRVHFFTYPEPGQPPAALPPDPRTNYRFYVTHFMGHSGCLVSWHRSAPEVGLVTKFLTTDFRLPNQAANDAPFCALRVEDEDKVVDWYALSLVPWLEASGNLPPIPASEEPTLQVILDKRSEILAKLADLQNNTSQNSTVSVPPGPKQFLRVAAVEVDTDGDGLADWIEVERGTRLDDPDTDGDGQNDLAELLRGSDPLSAASMYAEGTPENNEPRWEVQEKFVDMHSYGVGYYGHTWQYYGYGLPWYTDFFFFSNEPPIEQFNAKLNNAQWSGWRRTEGTINSHARYDEGQTPMVINGIHRKVRLARVLPEVNGIRSAGLLVRQTADPADGEFVTTSVEGKTFEIPAGQYASQPGLLRPQFEDGEWRTMTFFPLEVRIRQDNIPGPHGSPPMYFAQAQPANGIIEGELFSLWPNEKAYLTIAEPIAGMMGGSILPAGSVTWSAHGLPTKTDVAEYGIEWANPGHKLITLKLRDTEVTIRVNVPNTGSWGTHSPELALLVPAADILWILDHGLTARAKVEEHFGVDADHGGAIQDAVRHATWNALCAAEIGEDYTLLASTANEFDGRHHPQHPAFSSNTTMDLHNNAVGAAWGGILHEQIPDVYKTTEQWINFFATLFNDGDPKDKGMLWAWTPPSANVQGHNHRIRDSKQQRIFAP